MTTYNEEHLESDCGNYPTPPPTTGKLISKEDVEKLALKCWEKVNNELHNSGGVNPTPYILGFKDAAQQLSYQSVAGEAYLCPKCLGQGRVSRPPYLPADIQQWTSTQTDWQCDVCNGAKVLYKSASQFKSERTGTDEK